MHVVKLSKVHGLVIDLPGISVHSNTVLWPSMSAAYFECGTGDCKLSAVF